MSLILDALNRSREESNPVPGLSTHHPIAQVSVNRRQYLLWVALSVAIVVIAWLFMDRYSAPKPARQSDVSAAERAGVNGAAPVSMPQPTVTPAPAAVPAVEPAAEAPATLSPAADPLQAAPEEAAAAQLEAPPPVANLPEGIDQQSTDAAAVAATPAPAAAPIPEAASPANAAVAKLYENPDLAEEPQTRRPQGQSPARAESTEQTIDVDKMIKLAQQEANNLGLADHPVPLLIDLSQQVKDSIPTVYYLRHDYSSDSSRSTVVLNSKTLSVGDSPAAGMKVEEILPDSVVLNYQGTQFRLRALNSWINL